MRTQPTQTSMQRSVKTRVALRVEYGKYAAYTRPFAEYEQAELENNHRLVAVNIRVGESAACLFCGALRQTVGASCHCCGHTVR